MTTNSCYYSTNTDPLVNRRVAGVGFLMEAIECAKGASSVGRAAEEGEVVMLEICPRGNNKMVIVVFPCS